MDVQTQMTDPNTVKQEPSDTNIVMHEFRIEPEPKNVHLNSDSNRNEKLAYCCEDVRYTCDQCDCVAMTKATVNRHKAPNTMELHFHVTNVNIQELVYIA